MSRPRSAIRNVGCFAAVAGLLIFPVTAVAHGGAGAMSGEAEIKQLAMQPARILAQQALSTLRVSNDVQEAAVRLDAALESKDKSDIDLARLRLATKTLDAGNPKAAVVLLDEALSRPLGSDRGKALHESGREFTPGTGPQEIVAIILGAALLLLGIFALWRGRRVAPRS